MRYGGGAKDADPSAAVHLRGALASCESPFRTRTSSNAPGTSSSANTRPSAAMSNVAAEDSEKLLGTTSALTSRIPVTASAGFDVIDAIMSFPR